jgi:hypothetical protein
VELKLNGAHQPLVYADDVTLLGDNIDTINKNTEPLIDASKEVGLGVNAEKTKYMLVSQDQNAGQNWDIKIGNRSKNGVFWVVTPCGSCKNRRFGGTWRLLHQGDKNR